MFLLLFLLSLDPQPSLRPPELYSALQRPSQEYTITQDTVILLDGKPATLADLAKAKAVITRITAEGGKILRLEAKTPEK